MKKRWRLAVYAAALVIVLVSPNLVTGCGPFFDEAIFSFQTRPDMPLDKFLSGQLGVIQPTYRYRFLFAAYRQLSGVPLDQDEQAAIVALDGFVMQRGASSDAGVPASEEWTKARAKVVPGDEPKIDPTVTRDYATWTNCQDDAFRTAARTLDDRIGRYGASDANVREWVSGQDAVFANCGQNADAAPHAVPASAPAWLRADRAYQIAAAKFYAGDYDGAMQGFRAIAAEKSSPWSQTAPYLAARCLIRKAVKKVSERQGGEEPDKATMGEAEAALKAIVADPAQRAMRMPAEALLGFVEFRVHPDQRAEALAAALMKPHGGANFRQELMDYTLLLDATEPDDDLSDWIRTLSREAQRRGDAKPPSDENLNHAIGKWRATKSLPWLVAALMLGPTNQQEAAELRVAAEKVPPSSPAYVTAQYSLVRLLAKSNGADARARLAALANVAMPASATNLVQAQRARMAATFAAFLKEAQMKPVGTEDGSNGNETTDIPTAGGGIYFDVYGAEVLNKRASLARLEEAVQGDALAPPLRRKVALAAWTRAVLLEAMDRADALAQIVSAVEPSLREDMTKFRAAQGPAKQFEAVWILLQHPGLRPYVTPGIESRPESPGERDMLRDNWWCSDVGAHAAAETQANPTDCAPTFDCPDADPDPNFPFPAWANDAERAAAKKEWETLRKVGTAPNYLGERTMAWAKTHADDSRMPEALAQVVVATHYGCAEKTTTAVSKAAFTLLHQRYPQSEWAKKTRYYY